MEPPDFALAPQEVPPNSDTALVAAQVLMRFGVGVKRRCWRGNRWDCAAKRAVFIGVCQSILSQLRDFSPALTSLFARALGLI